MKYILLSIFTIGILTSCDPKSNYIDTSISNGKHDCSMLEYFHTSSYNWDSLLVMIQHAELESLFEGREPGYEQITFWGPTNHSIRRYMLDREITRISDMSKTFCKQIILMHVVKKRIMKDEMNFRIPDVTGKIVGATEMTTAGGVTLLGYREKSEYGGVADAGAVTLYLFSKNAETQIPLASPDIETLTGVVHSLNYNYTLGDLVPKTELEKIEKL